MKKQIRRDREIYFGHKISTAANAEEIGDLSHGEVELFLERTDGFSLFTRKAMNYLRNEMNDLHENI